MISKKFCADGTRNYADDTRNYADTYRRHITRAFGLQSRKKIGWVKIVEKNFGGGNRFEVGLKR